MALAGIYRLKSAKLCINSDSIPVAAPRVIK